MSFFRKPSRKPSRKGSRKGSAQIKGTHLMRLARRNSVSGVETQMEGFLEKKSSSLKGSYQSRYFVMAGHYLRYYPNKQSVTEEHLKGVFDMKEMQVGSTSPPMSIVTVCTHLFSSSGAA